MLFHYRGDGKLDFLPMHYCLFCSPYAMPSERVKQGSSDVGMRNMVHSCGLRLQRASLVEGVVPYAVYLQVREWSVGHDASKAVGNMVGHCIEL
jgi:hypothetical protein